MDGLLFVFGELLAKRIDTKGRWRSDSKRVLCWNKESLPNRRNWRSSHALRKTFVVNVGDVVDAEPTGAGSRVGILAARLNIKHVAFVIRCDRKLALVVDKLLVVVRIRDALQVAAVNRF